MKKFRVLFKNTSDGSIFYVLTTEDQGDNTLPLGADFLFAQSNHFIGERFEIKGKVVSHSKKLNEDFYTNIEIDHSQIKSIIFNENVDTLSDAWKVEQRVESVLTHFGYKYF